MGSKHDFILDARGEVPPVPTILCKEAMDAMQAGEVIKLIATFEGTVNNIRTLVEAFEYELIAETREGQDYVFLIRKTELVEAA